MTYKDSELENGPVEIVDLPSYNMVDLSVVLCMFYQRLQNFIGITLHQFPGRCGDWLLPRGRSGRSFSKAVSQNDVTKYHTLW